MRNKTIILLISLVFILVGCGSTNNAPSQLSQGNLGDNQTIDHQQGEKSTNVTADDESLLEQLEMAVHLDHQKGTLFITIELENKGEEQVELSFSSGQQYEIMVSNDANEKLYQYSEGKAFTEALVYKELEPNQSLKWQEEWNYSEQTSLPAGTYQVEITLLPTQVNKQEIEQNYFSIVESLEVDESVSELPQATEGSSDDIFRNLNVSGNGGKYSVVGEVDPSIDAFYYNVEDGHAYLVKETKMMVDSQEGLASFSIEVNIEKDKLPKSGTIMLYMYQKNLEDNQQLFTKAIPLERFN